MTAVEVAAPACPSWCPDAPHGWAVDTFATVKVCSAASVVTTDEDGEPVTVTLDRFASYDARDGLEVDAPTIWVDVRERLSADAALALAAALVEAAGRVR